MNLSLNAPAVLADKPGHVVVRVDVLNRLHDVGRALAPAPSGEDRGPQVGRRLHERVGRSLKRLPGVVIHGSQCLTVLNYGHGSIIHDSFVVWYHELSS